MSDSIEKLRAKLDSLQSQKEKLITKKADIDIAIAEITSRGAVYIQIAFWGAFFAIIIIASLLWRAFLSDVALLAEIAAAAAYGLSVWVGAALIGKLVAIPIDKKYIPLLDKQQEAQKNIWDVEYKIDTLRNDLDDALYEEAV
jgi:hypothetical protein